MPEQKNIKFDTIYGKLDNNLVNSLFVSLKPEISAPNTVLANLNKNPFVQNINNKEVLTGELCIVTKNNQDTNLDFEINDKGELIVHGDNAKNYSIDENGDLIYKYR